MSFVYVWIVSVKTVEPVKKKGRDTIALRVIYSPRDMLAGHVSQRLEEKEGHFGLCETSTRPPKRQLCACPYSRVKTVPRLGCCPVVVGVASLTVIPVLFVHIYTDFDIVEKPNHRNAIRMLRLPTRCYPVLSSEGLIRLSFFPRYQLGSSPWLPLGSGQHHHN